MDDTDDLIDERALATRALEEKLRLQRAFGDDVAQRFLRARGIVGDAMQEAVLEKYAAKQALRIAREALSVAAAPPAPRFQRSVPPTDAERAGLAADAAALQVPTSLAAGAGRTPASTAISSHVLAGFTK
ncbi:MAG TPA: hypothetical protein VFS95_13395 [Telluria sp.]|jgi:hypothetical protein|nr:hypothetical protein [Telluria sp.]